MSDWQSSARAAGWVPKEEHASVLARLKEVEMQAAAMRTMTAESIQYWKDARERHKENASDGRFYDGCIEATEGLIKGFGSPDAGKGWLSPAQAEELRADVAAASFVCQEVVNIDPAYEGINDGECIFCGVLGLVSGDGMEKHPDDCTWRLARAALALGAGRGWLSPAEADELRAGWAELYKWTLQLVENDGAGANYHAGLAMEARDQVRALLYYKSEPAKALLASHASAIAALTVERDQFKAEAQHGRLAARLLLQEQTKRHAAEGALDKINKIKKETP
jgi:hypothetical protein